MKLKNLLTLLSVLLLLAFSVPANGELVNFNEVLVDDDYEDHPWGGEEPDPGGGAFRSGIIGILPSIGSSYFLVDLIQVIIQPDYSNSNEDYNNDILPGNFGDNRVTDQKGQ